MERLARHVVAIHIEPGQLLSIFYSHRPYQDEDSAPIKATVEHDFHILRISLYEYPNAASLG